MHSLIGNIGGYLGLFLGKKTIQILMIRCSNVLISHKIYEVFVMNEIIHFIGYALVQIPDLVFAIMDFIGNHLTKIKNS